MLSLYKSSPGFRFRAQTLRGKGAAFTLIEVMVSMSILVLIVVLMNQLIGATINSTLTAGKLMDSDSQARLIFAKMTEDFAAMYQRTDINYYFLSQNGNDTFYFYSHAPGHIASADPAGTDDASLNTASLVGYRVSDVISGGTRGELERLGRGLHWMDVATQNASTGQAASVVFLPSLIKDAFSTAIADTHNNSSNADPSSTTAPEWDVIGDQVFRMEFYFMLTDGTLSVLPVLQSAGAMNNLTASAAPGVTADSKLGYSIGSRWYDTTSQIVYRCLDATAGAAVWTSIGLGDVKAVVVTLALMNSRSRATTNISAIVKAISSFADASACVPSGTVAATWMAKVNAPSTIAANSGLSPIAAGSIRVYERFFYLN